jgi:hypothetical protein
VSIKFRRHATWRDTECSRGNDERSIRTRQGFTERFNGAAISGGGTEEVAREGEVVLEGEVDHPV